MVKGQPLEAWSSVFMNENSQHLRYSVELLMRMLTHSAPPISPDTDTYTGSVVSGWQEVTALQDEVEAMDLSSGLRNVFFSPTWTNAWFKTLGPGKGQNQLGGKAIAITCRDSEGGLVGYWPFFQVPGIRKPGLWPFACQSADWFEPLVTTTDTDVLKVLFAQFKELWKSHSFLWLPLMRQDIFQEHIRPALKEAGIWCLARSRSENLRIELVEGLDFETFSKDTMGSKTRQTLARKRRRLEEKGAIRIETYTDYNSVKRMLNEIVRIEDANWKGQSGLGLFSKSNIKQFYFESLPQLADSGNLRLSLLRSGKKAVAYEMALIQDKDYLMHNLAYHPDFASYSPGLLLLLHNIEWCFENNFRTYDFMQGPDEYKARFANFHQPLLDVALFSKGPAGAAHYALMRFMGKSSAK